MPSDLIQIPFEWFVTFVWERHGPVVGILAAIVALALLIGLVFLAATFAPLFFGFA
jgi:hypothetical protein